jgi:DHA1 family tetracycline resistance protein-like MFS transporter
MYRFHWDEKMVGISLGAVGLLVGIVQGGLIRWTSPRLGNEKSIYIGLALYTIGMLLFAVATESWMMFAFLVPYCLGGIAGPALQSVISEKVPPNEQGEIQGTLASLMSASAIVGPPMMTNTFYFFTHKTAPFQLPGAPFILGGFLMLMSTIIAFYALHQNKKSQTS